MVLEKLSPYKWNKLLHIKGGGGEWVTVLISKLWVSNHELDLGSSLVLECLFQIGFKPIYYYHSLPAPP